MDWNALLTDPNFAQILASNMDPTLFLSRLQGQGQNELMAPGQSPTPGSAAPAGGGFDPNSLGPMAAIIDPNAVANTQPPFNPGMGLQTGPMGVGPAMQPKPGIGMTPQQLALLAQAMQGKQQPMQGPPASAGIVRGPAPGAMQQFGMGSNTRLPSLGQLLYGGRR